MLEAGEHRLPWFSTPEVLIVTTDGSEVPQALADYMRRFQPEWIDRYCLAADMAEEEAGALYIDGVLQEIIPPATRRLYWQYGNALKLV
ncbi:hypothetical protein CJ207_15070, partial [Klebsiella aerogenes]